VVAEGVETAEQLEFLKDEGCEFIQGYYFSKPLPLDELLPWIKTFSEK
jgi:EAL domain-containing protein (putative c-di-GMP-specific phosphodiesterase class I)